MSARPAIINYFANWVLTTWKKLLSILACDFSIGVTPNEVLFHGVPLWKSRTHISWSPNITSSQPYALTLGLLSHVKMPTSNTKAVIVSFFTLQGEPISNVFQNPESNLDAEVWLDTGSSKEIIESNIAEVEPQVNEEQQEASANKIQIVFSGQRVGRYKVTLRSNNEIVRGFPCVGIIVPGKADFASTCLIENRSQTLLITTGSSGQETIRIEPRDTFGNKIMYAMDLEKLADKVKLVLWKRVDSTYQREDMIVNDFHYVVYRGLGLCGECLNISLSFAPGQEGWYAAQILLEGRKIITPTKMILLMRIIIKKIVPILIIKRTVFFVKMT